MRFGFGSFSRLILTLFLVWAPTSQAAWVGAFLYKGIGADHIHLAVSDHASFNHAYSFNIWNDNSRTGTTMHSELASADRWLLFWQPESRDSLLAKWEKRYNAIRPQASLLSKNCAYTSYEFLEKDLQIAVSQERVWTYLAVGLWSYQARGLIPLPEAVFKQLRASLEKDSTTFYSHTDLKSGDTIRSFLAKLQRPQ